MTIDYEKAKCPKCGTAMEGLVYTVDPPIHVAKCPECGFEKRVEPIEDKPPIGCSPYYVSVSARICEFCEAIKRYSTVSGKHNQIRLWCKEIMYLNEMDRTLRYDEKQKVWTEDHKGKLHEMD